MFSKLEWIKNDLKHLLKHLFRGGVLICPKYHSQFRKNFENFPGASNKIRSLVETS